MKDCLILVERGVSELDLIKNMLRNGFRNYFASIRDQVSAETRVLFDHDGNKSVLADYGLASEVSLTSVVLATELHEAKLSFEVIDDDDVEHNYAATIRSKLAEFRMVALSTTYVVKLQTALRLIALIREADPEIPILVGGQGLSAWTLHFESIDVLYERLAQVDVLFFGEVEGSFAELVRRVGSRRSVSGIPGAVSPGDPNRTEPVSVDLDAVSIPNWNVVKEYDFNDGALRRHGLPRVAALEEGRGCSFKCSFCSYPIYASFRRKSPERVVAELRAVSDVGFHSMSFCGAEFLNPLHQSRPVFEAIAEAKLPIEIWAYARLDLVSHRPWIADLMDKANFRNIQFGMESGDRRILRAMTKNYDPTKMAGGVRLLKQRNIAIYASLVLGYPGETEETLSTTQSVLVDCNFDYVILHALSVVPGSPLWHHRDKYHLVVQDGRWSHPTMNVTELPKYVKRMFLDLSDKTTSVVNNITQNFSNTFFVGKPSFERLIAGTRTLQSIICNEWDPAGPGPTRRHALWKELSSRIDRVPQSLLS